LAYGATLLLCQGLDVVDKLDVLRKVVSLPARIPLDTKIVFWEVLGRLDLPSEEASSERC
jgi:hypothetical protein